MAKWVALLRGINVGGNRKIPMAELRRVCASKIATKNLRTYIASGNVVFEAESDQESLATDLSSMIRDAFGFEVPVLVLAEATMRDVLSKCPYPIDSGKAVHAYLCFEKPVVNHAVLDTLKAASEDVSVVDRTVWLHAAEGIGRSKLAAKMDKVLSGGKVTARNLNTIKKLVEMLDE